jgi:hypothetical protein
VFSSTAFSAATRSKAGEVQKHNREEFLRLFPQGFAALGYERDSSGNGTFLLGRWDEAWSYTAPFASPSTDWPQEAH